MSNIRTLLVNNQEALKRPTKEIEIPRLTESIGEPFNVTIKAINMRQLKETMRDVDTEDIAGRFEYACLVVREGLEDPKVTDKELQKSLEAPNWEELLNKIFLAGEIMTISEEILTLSDLTGEAMKKKAPAKKKKAKVEE